MSRQLPRVRSGREPEWRPLPPVRRRRVRRRPLSAAAARVLGAVTSLAVGSSTVALAAPPPPPTPIATIVAARPQPVAEFLIPPILAAPTVYVPPSTAGTVVPELTLPPPADRPPPRAAPPVTSAPVLVEAEATEPSGPLYVPVQLFARSAPAASTAPPSDCRQQARRVPLVVNGRYDANRIAQMTVTVFRCVLGQAGLGAESPTRSRRWNGERRWGFSSLAEQVAAEAVVVAYCESKGFDPRVLSSDNPWGYGGLFQMGSTEMGRFGARGASKFDPVDNAHAAANYFVWMYRRGGGWGGWAPWAVVNTNFADEVNDQVKVPVLPRFASTDPDFAGRRGPELPEWAVDPWVWEVPAGAGCPFTGGRWAPGRRLEISPALSVPPATAPQP